MRLCSSSSVNRISELRNPYICDELQGTAEKNEESFGGPLSVALSRISGKRGLGRMARKSDRLRSTWKFIDRRLS